MARVREKRVLLGVTPDQDPSWIKARLRITQPQPPNGSGRVTVVTVRVGVPHLLSRAAERTSVPHAPWELQDVMAEAGCQELALDTDAAAAAEGN